MSLSGEDAHRKVRGEMQCYDFCCPARKKPRIKFVAGFEWELYYECLWGAKHWSYATLETQLNYAAKIYKAASSNG